MRVRDRMQVFGNRREPDRAWLLTRHRSLDSNTDVTAPSRTEQFRRGGRRTFAARSRRTWPRLSTPARCMTNAAVACPRNVRAEAVDDASITGAAQRYSRAALGADVHSRLRCRTRPENRGRVVRTRSTRQHQDRALRAGPGAPDLRGRRLADLCGACAITDGHDTLNN
jgi:hypothetical protein